MPVLVFETPKGGAGKSTSAVILASELAHRGAAVGVIDCDPNKAVSAWAKRTALPASFTIETNVSEDTIVDQIDAAARRSAFVIVDLEGTASLMASYAISRADFVIIPTQGSHLDAAQSAKAIKLVRTQEKLFGRKIPFSILFTRTSVAIRTRTFQSIEDEFAANDIPMFRTHIHEREAYRAMFSFGATLSSLTDKEVSGLKGAIINAYSYVSEVVTALKKVAPKPVEVP